MIPTFVTCWVWAAAGAARATQAARARRILFTAILLEHVPPEGDHEPEVERPDDDVSRADWPPDHRAVPDLEILGQVEPDGELRDAEPDAEAGREEELADIHRVDARRRRRGPEGLIPEPGRVEE